MCGKTAGAGPKSTPAVFFFFFLRYESAPVLPGRGCGTDAGVGRHKTSPGLPRGKTPPMPCRPNYNLHKEAGGSPKLCFAASNFRGEPGRPAIRRFKSASLIRDVGLLSRKVRRRHAHSREYHSVSAHRVSRAGGEELIAPPHRQTGARQNAHTHPAARHRRRWIQKSHPRFRRSPSGE